MKKENFVQFPIWLLEELKSINEIKLFAKMYNGWQLMKDADGWYYRAISKLKTDAGINPKDSNSKITKILQRFEEMGILHIDRNGKKTNRFKFDEVVLFRHIEDNEEEGWEQNAPIRWEQNAPKQVEGDGSKTHPIYNTKENILKENNMEPNYKNEEVRETELFNGLYDDIDLIEVMNQEPNVEEWEREQNEYLQWIEENKKECNSSSGAKSQSQLNNDYVSRVFKWLDDEINYYFTIRDKYVAHSQCVKISNFVEKVGEKRDRFSSRQWEVVLSKLDRWVSISEKKDEYFNAHDNKKTVQATEDIENTSNCDILTDEDIISAFENNNSGGCAAPQYNEEEYQQAVADVCDGWTMGKLCSEGMETTIMKFQTIVENKLGCGVAWDKFRGDIIEAVNKNVA